MFLTLNEALKVLLEEGIENTIDRYKECATILREGLHELGLKFLIEDEKLWLIL